MKDRICKSLRLMSLGFTILSASWVQAQEVLVSLEAEDGIITLPAKVKPTNGSTIEGLSGGKYVGDNDPGSSIVFTDVEVPETGTYEFKTYYMSMQNRSIAVKVNNYSEFISTITNTTPGWDNPPTKTMSTYIYMDKGKNTIKITPQGNGGPNLDKFEIITTDVELPTPGEFPIVLEAETAQLFGNLKVKPTDGSSVDGLSGGKYIGDFDLAANSYLRFNDVEIPEEGTYELKVYSMGSSRALTIKVNHYEKSIIRTIDSPNWDNAPTSMVSTLVYLDKGKNTITFGLHEDNGPNLDKFEICTTTETIERPEVERIAYPFDFTDGAEITSPQSNATLALLADNDEYTSFVPESSSVEVVAKCEVPVLLTGFLLSAGIDSEIDTDSWKLYSSTDGSSWKELTCDKSTDLDGARLYEITQTPGSATTNAAQYYKLEAQAEGLQIAEWQLFGLPYTAAGEQNFPADLTEGLDIETHVTGYPTGESGDNFSEEFYRLFDRNMSTKYYAHGATSFYVEIELDKPCTIDSYALSSSYDHPDRDPRKWILNGYNEELGWVELDRQTDAYFPTRYSTLKYEVSSPLTFTRILLDVEANNGAGDIQLLKFQIFGRESDGSGIESIEGETVTIVSGQGSIAIRQAQPHPVKYSVYTLSGTLAAQGTTADSYHEIALPAGAYIISAGDDATTQTQKLIVK